MASQPESVEHLFAAALAHEPAEREAFLEEACGNDLELRRTVKELLAEDARASRFLKHSPFDFLDHANLFPPGAETTSFIAANEIPPAPPATGRFKPGQVLIDRFVIVRFIAKGGMGEVYEAEDGFLQGVHVALKTILPHIAGEPALQQRFEREVLLAREVSHPNLCPIYDIFHCAQPPPDFLFLTMRLLPGETLAARLQGPTPISITEGLAILKQMAGGLAAIHAAGIVHRDIKPNNIVLDGSGPDVRLRITDFGLARAYAAEPSFLGTGLVAGTPDYLAPELYLGRPPSQASDLFAFGVVLHQVFTGQKPTLAPDSSSVIVSPRLNTPGVPSFCVQLIVECLDRDPIRRCQAFERALGSLGVKERTRELWTGRRFAGAAVGAQEQREQSPKWLRSALVAAALVTLVVGFLAIRTIKNGAPFGLAWPGAKSAASGGMRTVPLTNFPGSVGDPAFSPDGEKIAFIWDGENPVKGDLYTQLVGGERPLRLTHTKSGFICCANWSPDGREIAFARCYDNGGGVFVVPALGGSERKLTDVVCHAREEGHPQWTADGKSLVIADRCNADGPSGIVVFSLATGEKRCLHSPPHSDAGDMLPTLSPDGKDVAFIAESTRGRSDLYIVALAGGNLRRLTNEGKSIMNLMWATDGRHISFDSARSGLVREWRISRAGGNIEPETKFPGVGTLSRDGRRLAFVEPPDPWRFSSTQVWRAELSSAGGQVLSLNPILTSGGFNGGMQPSPDGRQIVFTSPRSGRPEIWKSSADGNDPVQLTFFNGQAGTARWSPDNHWITFDSRSEHSQVFVMDAEGRNLHRITSGDYNNLIPSWSRDGASIYFASNRTGNRQVWKRNLASGQEEQLTRQGGFAAFESYDGKMLYYSRFEGGGIWRVPVDGGPEERITEGLHLAYWGDFAVTETGLYLLDVDANPSPTILYYDFQTRQLTPVLRLKQNPIPWSANLAASRDGRTLFFAEGDSKSSITMVENFQ
jgi:Tol biopolymer transport system component